MNVMDRFTLRSMKQNKKWTVVTIIGVIISTAMIAAVSTFCSSFMALEQKEVMAGTGNWHASISDVSVNKINDIKKADFAGKVVLSRNVGYALLKDAQNSDKPYIFIKQYDDESRDCFPTTLVSGRMPKNSSELAIPQHMKTNGGITYKIGDKVTFDIGKRISSTNGEELFQNAPYRHEVKADEQSGIMGEKAEKFIPETAKTYTIVGIINRPTFERYSAPGYTAITYLDASSLKQGETVDVSLLSKHLNHDFYSKVNNLAKSIGKSKSDVSFNNELLRCYGIVSGDNMQRGLYEFAAVLIIIIMIASISLIYNAFAISVSERTKQLGMLASVGATRRQKSRNVYFEGFIIGIIGIPIGILAGISGIGITFIILRPLMNSFVNFSTSGLSLSVSPLSIVAAIVFAAFTIFISAWIPARRASKITPIDAIRQAKEIKLTGRTVKTSRLTRAMFGFEGEIALKNLKRSRKKYRATVLSLIISLVLFLTVSFYANMLDRASNIAVNGVNYDISVGYTSNASSSVIKDTNTKIKALSLVKDWAVMKNYSGNLTLDGAQLTGMAKQAVKPDKNGKYNITAIVNCVDNETFDKYAKSIGTDPNDYKDPTKPRAIFVNYGNDAIKGQHAGGEIVAIHPGDSLDLSILSGQNGGKKMKLEIGALTDKRPVGVLTLTFKYVSIVMSEGTASVFETPSGVQMYLTSDDSEKLQKQIESLTSKLNESQVYINNLAEQEKKESNLMFVLGVFIYGFIILICLICIANIFNTITTNIALRRKEFAMLRSVGMTPGSFSRMLRYESVFYGLKALLYGLPISIGIALLLYKIQGQMINMSFALPWQSYIIAIALIFVLVSSTMLYSSAKIKKENIIDALKDDNC